MAAAGRAAPARGDLPASGLPLGQRPSLRDLARHSGHRPRHAHCRHIS